MFAAFAGPGLLLGVIIPFLAIGVPLWAIVDALSRPSLAFYQADTHKTAWVMVLAVSTFIGIGFFLGAYYLMSVRHKVKLEMATLARRR
jgi:Protein of unknown function (DUF2516)